MSREPTSPAVARFRALAASPDESLREFFAPDRPVYSAAAPGRLDVMGGIADYSGSLVLQLPINRHTVAMLQLTHDANIEIVSIRDGVPSYLGADAHALLYGPLSDGDHLAEYFRHPNVDRWGAYVFGVLHACLIRHAKSVHRPPSAFRLLIDSNVPEGKGVSSSAALEVACCAAIAAAFEVTMSAEEVAKACQWAENNVAGAPCGIMDQMSSACGMRDHLLQLRCQPARIEGQVAIPAGYRFFGIDSGIRHAVTGPGYAAVRTAAFMGYRIIASLAGLVAREDAGRVFITDSRWEGYLANIGVAEFEDRFRNALPEQMLGADFLAQFQGITDDVTRVDPERWYPVRAAAEHPVRENSRVERFAGLLTRTPSDDVARSMGAFMYESHDAYNTLQLGSDGTDLLVDLVRDAGLASGVFGAKITGGGSGGTVAVLARSNAESVVRSIARRYEELTGRAAQVFAGSGAGMAEQGVLLLHHASAI